MLLVDGLALDDPHRPYVIAEISGNHGQDYAIACALVQAAAEAGADAVKYQLLTPELICADIPLLTGHDAAHDAWCQRLGVTRMRDLFTLGGLPRAWCLPLKQLAEDLGVTWFATPFSVEEARFLVEEIGVQVVKVASGDLTFTPMLAYLNTTGLPLIVSTGGATLDECQAALEGPLADAWVEARVVLLHCVSAYPADLTMMNLRCLQTMGDLLDVPVGLSDHTLSTTVVPTLAAALGACIFEKHLRLAGDTTSVDAGHALDPEEFALYVRRIRETPAILGDGIKRPQPGEMHDRLFARRDPSDFLRPMMRGRLGEWE